MSDMVGMEALLRRVDSVVREIEETKRERAAIEARTARAQLAVVHSMKRLRRQAAAAPRHQAA